MTDQVTGADSAKTTAEPLALRLNDQLGRASEAPTLLERLQRAREPYFHSEHQWSDLLRLVDEAADEIERLREIVKSGRAAYSGYGLLATPPGHAMHTKAGDALRAEWLRKTDEYLHDIEA